MTDVVIDSLKRILPGADKPRADNDNRGSEQDE